MDRKLPCRKNSTGCNKWISIHTNSSHLWGTTGNRTGAPTFLTLHKWPPNNFISNVHLFADDCLLYLPVKSDNNISILQNDLIKLVEWQNTWFMKFNPTKCFTMTLASRKPTSNLYTFCGQQLKSVQSHCYLVILNIKYIKLDSTMQLSR